MKKREPNRAWLNEVFQKGGKMNLVASQLYIREKRINYKLNIYFLIITKYYKSVLDSL